MTMTTFEVGGREASKGTGGLDLTLTTAEGVGVGAAAQKAIWKIVITPWSLRKLSAGM